MGTSDRALRDVLGESLAAVADADPRVLVLDGDVGNSTGTAVFEAAHPDRHIQCGIAEQNMVGMAAGLATLGFVPFVSTFSCFAVARALDSIRVLIAQPALNVKILGGYAGLLTGMTGKTHQMFDDVAIIRTLPNMVVLAPADEREARQAIAAAAGDPRPVYMQITREPAPSVFDVNYRFEIGRGVRVREGTQATVISTGVQTARVAQAADRLAARGVDVAVLHLPTIKPIDTAAILEAAHRTALLITVEEQSVLGGLGGAVAEVVAESVPVIVRRLGINDCYGQSGRNEDLLDRYRLSAERVADDVEALVRRFSAAGNGGASDRNNRFSTTAN
jgi:transketolase